MYRLNNKSCTYFVKKMFDNDVLLCQIFFTRPSFVPLIPCPPSHPPSTYACYCTRAPTYVLLLAQLRVLHYFYLHTNKQKPTGPCTPILIRTSTQQVNVQWYYYIAIYNRLLLLASNQGTLVLLILYCKATHHYNIIVRWIVFFPYPAVNQVLH